MSLSFLEQIIGQILRVFSILHSPILFYCSVFTVTFGTSRMIAKLNLDNPSEKENEGEGTTGTGLNFSEKSFMTANQEDYTGSPLGSEISMSEKRIAKNSTENSTEKVVDRVDEKDVEKVHVIDIISESDVNILKEIISDVSGDNNHNRVVDNRNQTNTNTSTSSNNKNNKSSESSQSELFLDLPLPALFTAVSVGFLIGVVITKIVDKYK